MISVDEAKRLAKKNLSPKRYEHTCNVRKLAVKLAKAHGADEKKAALAALLHDIAKELPRDRLLQIFTENAIIAGNAAQRPAPVWHGAAAAILAQTQYGVDDGEILSAIRCHTTGRPGMTKLDKIIYLADMASYERTYPEAEQLRRHALADLDRTAIEGLGLSIAWLKAGGKPVDEGGGRTRGTAGRAKAARHSARIVCAARRRESACRCGGTSRNPACRSARQTDRPAQSRYRGARRTAGACGPGRRRVPVCGQPD